MNNIKLSCDPICGYTLYGYKFIKNVVNRYNKRDFKFNLEMTVRVFIYSSSTLDGRIAKFIRGNNNVYSYITADLGGNYPVQLTDGYLKKYLVFNNVHESLVFAFGHEFAHFLQINSGSTINNLAQEKSASRFGYKLVNMYRSLNSDGEYSYSKQGFGDLA